MWDQIAISRLSDPVPHPTQGNKMGFLQHFYPEYNFAFTQCYGVVDDNNLRVHILSFNIEAKGMKNIRELADARKVENAGKVTVQGLVQLSELGKERAAGKDGLLAIVVAKPLIDTMARIYATSIAESKKRHPHFL